MYLTVLGIKTGALAIESKGFVNANGFGAQQWKKLRFQVMLGNGQESSQLQLKPILNQIA